MDECDTSCKSYVINAAGKKTNHTIYHKGKGSLGIDNYTLYMADRISWRNVSLMPGVRYDYDNYLSNHNSRDFYERMGTFLLIKSYD